MTAATAPQGPKVKVADFTKLSDAVYHALGRGALADADRIREALIAAHNEALEAAARRMLVIGRAFEANEITRMKVSP